MVYRLVYSKITVLSMGICRREIVINTISKRYLYDYHLNVPTHACATGCVGYVFMALQQMRFFSILVVLSFFYFSIPIKIINMLTSKDKTTPKASVKSMFCK